MIDEVAEVKEYMDGKKLNGKDICYRACYMITKYYKKLGLSESETFVKVAAWARKYNLALRFSLAGCVASAYLNPRELRCGTTVKISQRDADTIRMYSTNKQDRRVALALMCCAKAYAGQDGFFGASSSALASWLGMDSGNLRKRHLDRLVKLGFAERMSSTDTTRGWQKNYYRNAYRFRLLVPYDQDGQWELIHNDIQNLYEQVFNEPY